MATEDNFLDLLTETLELEGREPTLASVLYDYLEWDSLGMLSTASMIEEEYGVVLSSNDLCIVETVGDLWQLVVKMGE